VFVINCCQYKCSQLIGKTRLRNDLICVDWRIEPYSLHTRRSLTHYHHFCHLPQVCNFTCFTNSLHLSLVLVPFPWTIFMDYFCSFLCSWVFCY